MPLLLGLSIHIISCSCRDSAADTKPNLISYHWFAKNNVIKKVTKVINYFKK